MARTYSDNFWKLFDIAVKTAEKNEDWILSQNTINNYMKTLPAEVEEMLYTAFLLQWTIAMNEMYKLIYTEDSVLH